MDSYYRKAKFYHMQNSNVRDEHKQSALNTDEAGWAKVELDFS